MQPRFLTVLVSIYKWQTSPCRAVKQSHHHLNPAVNFVNQARSSGYEGMWSPS